MIYQTPRPAQEIANQLTSDFYRNAFYKERFGFIMLPKIKIKCKEIIPGEIYEGKIEKLIEEKR
jgi:hypothetical protein